MKKLLIAISIMALTFSNEIFSQDLSKTRIYFTSNRNGSRSIYSVKPDGSDLRRITNNVIPGHNPIDVTNSFSKDRNKLLYTTDPEYHGGMALFLLDMKTKKETRVTGRPTSKSAATWEAKLSPDGKKALFTTFRNGVPAIFIVNTDGSELKKLTEYKNEIATPDWSPDGNKIIYSYQADEHYEIWTMNVDGSNKKQLTKNPKANEVWATYSPDGKKIAFVSNHKGDYGIFTMNSNGKNKKRIAKSCVHDSQISWSPDNSKIVFAYKVKGNNADIYIVNVDGTGLKRIINNSGYDWSPAWSPSMN